MVLVSDELCGIKLLFLSVESGGNEESDPAAVCS